MKMNRKIEKLLKAFYGNQRRTMRPSHDLDQRVFNDLDGLSSPCRCPVSWTNKLIKLAAASIVLAAVGTVLLNKPAHHPQIEQTATPVLSIASSQPITMFSINMVFRNKGIDAALKELDRPIPKQKSEPPMLTFQALRTELAYNGKH
jgi:hypothetical protein